MKREPKLLLLPLLLLILALPTARAEESVVRAVLFWSQTCPHCHVVLTETLPPLQEKYGDQLQVLAVELSDPAGYELWILAIETLRIPADRLAVPMLIIGDRVLVGSYDIPQQLPGLIENHLAAGGLDYPPIPGLEAWLDTVPTPTSPPPTPTSEPTAETVVHFWLFYDSHCDSCLVLKEEILPPILARSRSMNGTWR
jgi:thiol-disulfide isomerase/thioredoxin